MGISQRRERERRRLRRKILDAARDLFTSEGYESVSMRRIAARIEYSPTTIYLYFKDKAELLDAIRKETFDSLVTSIEKAAAKHADPVIALQRACRAYVEFGLKRPNHYTLAFMRSPSADTSLFQCLHLCVGKCVEAGTFGGQDTNAVSQAIWTAMHGITSLLIALPAFPWVARTKLIEMTIRRFEINTSGS